MDSARRLPHFYPQDRRLFFTWHLHQAIRPDLFPRPSNASAGQIFMWLDRQLDGASSGPTFLRQEAIAQLVVDSLFRGEALGHYQLGPFVVMPNHVHVLLLPEIAPRRLMNSLKGSTAREANCILGRTGQAFWQKESYDHWVRDRKEWTRIASYIENNPVRAGLVTRAEDYCWSSACCPVDGDRSVAAARRSACATNTNANMPMATMAKGKL